MQNFAFKFQAVAEKTAKNVRGLLYFAAPCSLIRAGCTIPLKSIPNPNPNLIFIYLNINQAWRESLRQTPFIALWVRVPTIQSHIHWTRRNILCDTESRDSSLATPLTRIGTDYTRDWPELFANDCKNMRGWSVLICLHFANRGYWLSNRRPYVILRDFLLTNRRYGRCPMSVPIHYYCRRHYVVTSYSDVTIHQAHTNDLDNLITSASEI